MDSIGIAAIAYALPDTTLDLTSLAARGLLESPASLLTEFGFGHIHVSDAPADAIALQALRKLIDEHEIDPESVDAIFFAGALPESHRVAGDTRLDGFS